MFDMIDLGIYTYRASFVLIRSFVCVCLANISAIFTVLAQFLLQLRREILGR